LKREFAPAVNKAQSDERTTIGYRDNSRPTRSGAKGSQSIGKARRSRRQCSVYDCPCQYVRNWDYAGLQFKGGAATVATCVGRGQPPCGAGAGTRTDTTRFAGRDDTARPAADRGFSVKPSAAGAPHNPKVRRSRCPRLSRRNWKAALAVLQDRSVWQTRAGAGAKSHGRQPERLSPDPSGAAFMPATTTPEPSRRTR